MILRRLAHSAPNFRLCWPLALTLAFAALWATGCGASQSRPQPPSLPPDGPVAPDQPRAQLRLRIDLAATGDCEEAFDLALYANRGIELVEWAPATRDCHGRVITIRFLSQRLSAEQVLAAVRRLTATVQVEPSEPPEPPAKEPRTAGPETPSAPLVSQPQR
jgi:hypothetical protein